MKISRRASRSGSLLVPVRLLRRLREPGLAAYESATLTVDTQASYGAVTGQVSGGLLTFPGVGAFARPATADILSCATGPFSTAGASARALSVIPRLAAAFNRGTLLVDSDQPDGENPAATTPAR